MLAELQPTTEGVEEEIERLTREVADRYYRKRLSRVLGLRRRSAITAKAKYERIAGQYREVENALSEDIRAFAIANETPCFISKRALLECHRRYLAQAIDEAGGDSIMEVGAGELNTLLPVVALLTRKPSQVIALDISEARLKAGQPYDEDGVISRYVEASASAIPLPDKSVDVIFTSHCLEQSPELVAPALKEFARVARRRVILAEPAYELAHPLQQKRIRKIGYARGIATTAKRLGLDVLSHELMPVRQFLNGSALTVIGIATGD